MTTRTVDATQELSAFLRTRRERLDPRDFGLPSRRQARRTPGLRRRWPDWSPTCRRCRPC
ncbi:hypothetical protein OIU91_40055 [Streptomyces sp. NBC_01456]|uniref:hypothetical protein n=1 Tax=unclassified Streptomyces TaxID=2593676 RepID=UPI002E35A583|nr:MULTISPECIES: hypothetical protein [unclassified Streptomyces]